MLDSLVSKCFVGYTLYVYRLFSYPSPVNIPNCSFQLPKGLDCSLAAMFRSVARTVQTESDYGYCHTGKTPIFSKSCTGLYLSYIGIIHFVAQTTADYTYFGPNVALISLCNLPCIWTWFGRLLRQMTV